MKTISIFYFSGTGNTKYAVDYFVSQINKKGFDANSYSIEYELEFDLITKVSDIVLFFYPIYVSDLPNNMKEFINNLPNQKLDVGTICTQYMFSGDGGYVFNKKLRKKGYNHKWSFQVNMPNNLCLPSFPIKTIDDYQKLEPKLVKSKKKIDKIVEIIASEKKHLSDKGILNLIAGLTQRPFYNFSISKNQKSLNVNTDKCTRCALCISACPKNVIVEEGDIVDHFDKKNCVSCFRCINFCPFEAIEYNGKLKKPLYKGPTKQIYKQLFTKK